MSTSTPQSTHRNPFEPHLVSSLLPSLHPQPIDWVILGLIPAAHLTLLLAPPQTGKTALALDLAARAASGAPLPCSPPSPSHRITVSPSRSVTILADQLLLETLPARLAASSLSPDAAQRIHILSATDGAAARLTAVRPPPPPDPSLPPELAELERLRTRLHTPPLDLVPEAFPADIRPAVVRMLAAGAKFRLSEDLRPLEAALRASSPSPSHPDSPSPSHRITVSPSHPPSLLLIDSLPSFLETPSRKLLIKAVANLEDFAQRTGIAILAPLSLSVRHSYALDAAAALVARLPTLRTAFTITHDRADPATRLLVPVRSSLAPRPPILAFTLDGPRVVWCPEPAIAVEPIEASRAPELALAAAWLRDQLTPGPAPAAALTTRARHDGISPITLRRAKSLLNIRSERRGPSIGPNSAWQWSLPDQPPQPQSPENPPPSSSPPKALIAA